jgi:hypothetical protein
MEDPKWQEIQHDQFLPLVITIVICLLLVVLYKFKQIIPLATLCFISLLFLLIILAFLGNRYLILRKGITKFFNIDFLTNNQDTEIETSITERIRMMNPSIRVSRNTFFEKTITGNYSHHYFFNRDKKKKMYIQIQPSQEICVVVLTRYATGFTNEIDILFSH